MNIGKISFLISLLCNMKYCQNSNFLSNYAFLQTNLISQSSTQVKHQNCICVPYWQCKEDFSGLIEDEIEIMDVRTIIDNELPSPQESDDAQSFVQQKQEHAKDPECSGDFDVCCKVQCGRLYNGFGSGGRPSLSESEELETIDNAVPYATNLIQGRDPFALRTMQYTYNSSRMDEMNSSGDYEEDIILGFRIVSEEGENNEATFGEFPWMLGLLDGNVYHCGATLIHPEVAITAAHCVDDLRTNENRRKSNRNSYPYGHNARRRPINGLRPRNGNILSVTGGGNNNGVHRYRLRAGEWNWESRDEPLKHQDRYCKKIILHPNYHSGSLRNDIAILIVDSPFKLTETVGVACLPTQGAIYQQHERCIASGWGKNAYDRKGTYQSVLKKMELPLVERDVCLRTLQIARLGPYFNLHQSFICAGGERNKDTCKGDGGSPLVCPIEGQPDRFIQAGIVSWGLTCGLQNTPGVYVNVGMFIKWIDKQMAFHNYDTQLYKNY